jgi:hypothetical protein
MGKIEADMASTRIMDVMMALSYPLFFPRGEIGWHMDISKK